MASELDNAINKAPGLYITKKLQKAKDEKNADAATLLKMLKWYRFGVFLLHLVVGVFSLGIVPLIYYLGKQHLNKTRAAEKQEHTNFFSYAFYESKEAIDALTALSKETAVDSSEDEEVQNSQHSDHNHDTENESTAVSLSKNEEDEEEALYRFALESKHPLGPRLGGRILKEDPLHKDTERKYEDRTSATILKNGHILACDVNLYTNGGEDRAIGIFDHGKNLLKPLFRYMQTQIENNFIAFEYQPEKFIYFYGRPLSKRLCFNDGRDEFSLVSLSCEMIIPTYFEFTSKKFEVTTLALTQKKYHEDLNAVYCLHESLATTNEKDKLNARIVKKNFGSLNAEFCYALGYVNIPIYSPIHHKDDPTEISAIAYNPFTSFVYVANVQNKLYRVPVKQTATQHMIERNGDAQSAELKEGKTITKIAASDDGKYLLIAREDGQFEVYQQLPDFSLNFLTKSFIDPSTEGKILDVKFVADSFIFAATNKTVVCDIEQLRNLEKMQDKANAEQATSKKAQAALREHHTAQQASKTDYTSAKETKRVMAYILNNGHIAAYDEVIFTEKPSVFMLHTYKPKNGELNPLPTNRYLQTPSPIVRQFFPFQKNDRFIYFVRDREFLKILDSKGQTISTKHSPTVKSHLIIPIDYNLFTDPQTAFAVEFCKGEVKFHSFTCGNFNNFDTGTLIQNTVKEIKAATYNTTNHRLYCIDGEQLKFITIKNGQNPHQDYFSARDKRLIDVTHMTVTKDGHYLATTKADGTIALYDIEEFNQNPKAAIKFIGEIKIEDRVPMAISFVENDKDLLIATDKQSICINNFQEEVHKYLSANTTPN